MSTRRAVVTGLGAVTPLGGDVETSWSGLIANQRAIRRITLFDPTGLRNENAGQVDGWSFSPASFDLDAPPDRAVQFLLTAAREAVLDTGLPCPLPGRAGACVATNFGASNAWEEYAAGYLAGEPAGKPFASARFDDALGLLESAYELTGPGMLISMACASGSASVGLGLDAIRYGRADVMLCGGHDSLAPTHLAGLSVLRTMTADDILPFSANRSGTLFGEGSGVLVLEELDHALARGARIYAEVLGWAENNNAYHLTAPDPGGRGMIRVLAAALADAGVKPSEIDYINAHGTGTEYHDPEETHAIKTVLGDHAYEIAVSSIKGAIGHLMGAAGSVEAVATVKAIQTGTVPPTMNDGATDPGMDLDFVVNQSKAFPVSCAASISAGIGGHNSCVVFRALSDQGGEAQ